MDLLIVMSETKGLFANKQITPWGTFIIKFGDVSNVPTKEGVLLPL